MLNNINQHTVGDRVSCSGVALHSGNSVNLTLHPAPPNTGVVFLCTAARSAGVRIAAHYENIVETRLNTTLGTQEGVNVGTVEHLMAALLGCGIDNVIIEIDGTEVPIMDGSAAPFVALIDCVGAVEQNARRRILRILRSVEVRDGASSLRIEPIDSDDLNVHFLIEYDNPLIKLQRLEFSLLRQDFRSEICCARTYGFEKEVDSLRAAGLALGGSLDNAIVVSDNHVLNEDGLRYEDEFVRHKVLDLMGDFYLAGGRIAGTIYAERSGHALNKRLLWELRNQPDCWSFENMEPQFTQWSEQQVAASL